MYVTPLLGNLLHLIGVDTILIFVVFLAFLAGLMLLAFFFIRRAGSSQPPPPTEERLRKLDALRTAGLVTPDEYAEQRRRILGQI